MKTRFHLSKGAKKRGQSLIELALTLTILLLLLSGATDFGAAFIAFISMRDAAQEGALFGAVNPIIDTNGNQMYDAGEPLNIPAVANRVVTSTTGPVDLANPARASVAVTFSSPPCAGGWVRVDVYYDYQVISPLIGGTTIPLHARVVNTILRPGCH
jgi:Flp pilus assembly protein TadG